MHVYYDDARDIKAIIQTLTKLVDEALFEIKPEGIKLTAVDRAKISLINIDLPAEMFKEYEVHEEYKFGFNTQYMSKLMKAVKGKQAISLDADNEEVVKLTIIGAINRDFNIRNIQVLPPEIPEANFEFDVKASISSKGLKTAISEVSQVSKDSVTIYATEEKVVIRGGEESKVESEFTKETGALADIEFTKEATATYDINYIDNVLQLTKLSDYTKLAFSDQKPLQMEFSMEGGGKVTYLLAPKLS